MYPLPPLVMSILMTEPVVMIPQVAAAPTPSSPGADWIVIIGVTVYPQPAFIRLIAKTLPP